MAQFPLFSTVVDIASAPAPIGLDTLLSGLAPNCDVITGLFAFTVLAMAALAWLTAAPVARRPAARQTAPGAPALV